MLGGPIRLKARGVTSTYDADFAARILSMDDETLHELFAQMCARPGDYRSEAVAAVDSEVARRTGRPSAREVAARKAQEAAQRAEAEARRERALLEAERLERYRQARAIWEYKVRSMALTCGRCGKLALPIGACQRL